jgi:two-component system LytT family sensor kinase
VRNLSYRYLNRQSQKKIELEKILKEQAQLKANVLKKQLDPHFMFNTLNVLSGLVYQDADKSAQFIKELSRVYRYVLEQSEELVSTVKQEFNFLESYLFLLKIRFEDKISITIDIPSNRKDWLLPSMTLELLVENAVKHNVVDSERPLYLNFSIKNNQLVVKNNLQQRNNFKESLGLGLKNLKTRLDLLGKKNYHFGIVENDFVAIIPFINPKDV